MHRRDFLHTGSLAMIAAAGLPNPIRSKQPANNPSIYKTILQAGAPNQLLYELGLFHSTVQNLSAATEEEKTIGLKVKLYETVSQATPAKTGEFKYIIQKSEINDKESNLWKLTTKLDKKIAGDYSFPKEYPANLGFLCMPGFFVKSLGNNDSVLMSIPYTVAASSSYDDDYGDEDCFLTTACTQYKNLPDDCEELTTLRSLRNNFMTAYSEGKDLIRQYETTGPAIVTSINSFDNKAAIYDYMYYNMIVLSVKLVQQGKYEEAVNYYKLFVKTLKEKYC